MNQGRPWRIILVEDQEDVRDQVQEFLEGEDDFSFGKIQVSTVANFTEASKVLRDRKADLIILDVFDGDVSRGEDTGRRVLEEWKRTGSSPVIFYTALPEAVSAEIGPFVRIVAKDSNGLQNLAQEITHLFSIRIPQIHRAIHDHFDKSLRDYMWEFVSSNWNELDPLSSQPDFIRLLLKRLALQFSSVGVAELEETLGPNVASVQPSTDTAHPTEFYVKPPIGDIQLGDILSVTTEGQSKKLYVILWPSCDLVLRNGRCKVDKALCALIHPLIETEEYRNWITNRSTKSRQRLKELITNNRAGQQKDRFFFIPGAWDIPAGIIDFLELQHFDVNAIRRAPRIATIASPFAESIASRFTRYLGRLGTPDLDVDFVLSQLDSGSTAEGES